MTRLNESQILVFLLAVVSILTAFDLVSDLGDGVTLRHALIETLIIAVCLVGVLVFIRKLRNDNLRLHSSLDQAREDLKYWKHKSSTFVQGLALEMEDQFNSWSLTKSEKAIALLLIKGFSTKEIAHFRNTTEKTIRVQTSSIYKKAKVSNRNELTAFFLEDLLLPTEDAKNEAESSPSPNH